MSAQRLTTYGELADVIASLGLIVRETRRARRLSVRAAGKEAGISFATISRVENGELPEGRSLLLLLRWLDGAP